MGDWEEQAACVGHWEMFEITDRHSNFRRDIKDAPTRDRVIKSHNLKKFPAALAMCSTCPVFDECRASIDGEDAVWTVRAGMMPSMFRSRSRGRPRKDATVFDPAEAICSRGHRGEYRKHADGGYRCMECRRVLERPAAKRKQPLKYLSGTCPKGHVDKFRMRNKKTSSGKKYCAECNRLGRQRSREREKAARMAS